MNYGTLGLPRPKSQIRKVPTPATPPLDNLVYWCSHNRGISATQWLNRGYGTSVATLTNNAVPGFSSGNQAQGVSFDGMSGYCAFATNFGVASGAAFSLLVRAEFTSASLKGTLIRLGGVSLGVGNTTIDDLGNNIVALDEGLAHRSTSQPIGTGIHTLAITLIGGTYRFFRDGLFVASTAASSPSLENTAFLGANGTSNAPNPRYFAGTILDALFYARTLSDAEMLTAYNAIL